MFIPMTENGVNWVEVTFRRLRDGSLSARTANVRHARYSNRITFTGGMALDEALRPSLVSEIRRIIETVPPRSSVQEFPDFRHREAGVSIAGCAMLASEHGDDYQQFLFRLNCIEGRIYAIFSPGLIEEDNQFASPESIVELVRQKVVEPVNRLSTVFEGYDKDTTFAIIPAYFNVLRRLMNTRLEKLEAALRSNKLPALESPGDSPDTAVLETKESATKRVSGE